MKISAFTIVRNAVQFDYPVVESINSVLPVCDEFIVLIGKSEDNTHELIKGINSEKIKIFESTWDDNLREGGRVLAVETDKSKNLVSQDSDWLIYIQADEVLHEKYYDNIIDEINKYQNDNRVDGLLLKYIHFYGSYKFIADSRKWYRREIRIIRNDKNIKSWGDAQGFRKDGQKLKVKLIDAYMYHYGWVKSPYKQQEKQKHFNRFWHDDEWLNKKIGNKNQFDYSKIDSLKYFQGTHPESMHERINNTEFEFYLNIKEKNMNLSNRLLYIFEKTTGIRPFEYKNYELI